ncbi:MAG TPA: DUF4153 domain-containing protein, partial [Pyrinomonadaceae bacterium]|nr:DUF4153 domain-containing protein [Pyrinomonadaceae bacterium]
LPLVMKDVEWGAIPRRGVMRHAWAVVRGLVIAVPLLFVFGALFMAADAVFEGIIQQTFQVDVAQVFSHLFLVGLCAWLVGGFLRGMMLAEASAVNVVLDAVPAAYTSVTADDKEQDATRGGDATNEIKRQPQSVVDSEATTASTDDEATTASANVGDVISQNDSEKSCDDAKPADGDGERVQTKHVASPAAPPIASPVASRVASPLGLSAVPSAASPVAARASKSFSLGAVEVGVVLGLLDVMFACFVAVQVRYFFGGAAWVMSVTGLTYADYARRGFFELVWVAALVLPLLLVTHALLRKDQPSTERLFRLLAGTQVALLFVIMASAVARMRLYQSEYGLTELRLYTTAFMFWLGLVFFWFVLTVLRGARERFACGALVSAFLVVGLLHVLNPDAFIVRTNAAHARAGRSFDAAYAASLSADAVPALVSAAPTLSREARCVVGKELTRLWSQPLDGEDWRSWSLARWRARRAVRANDAMLSENTCPPPISNVPAMTTTTNAFDPPAPKATTPGVPPTGMTGTTAPTATTNSNAPAATMTTGTQRATVFTRQSEKPVRGGGKKISARKTTRAGRANQRTKAR